MAHAYDNFDFDSYFNNLDNDQFKHIFKVDLMDYSFLDHDLIKKSKKELWKTLSKQVKINLINTVY